MADVFRPHLFDYWQGLASSGDLVWHRFQVEAQDTISTVVADDASFKLDVVNYTGGAIDTSWTDADLDSVAGGISTHLLVPYAQFMSTGHAFTMIRAYRMTFAEVPSITDPEWQTRPVYLQSGPPVKEWPLSTAAGAGSPQAPQVACSVTLESPIRSHWGRFYLPWVATSTVSSAGRMTSAAVDTIATAVDTLCDALASSEFYLVIPSSQDQKRPVRALQQVTAIRVDDVFDVVRRRRSKYANYRKIIDINTP